MSDDKLRAELYRAFLRAAEAMPDIKALSWFGRHHRMPGLFASLTPEQRAAVLAYDGAVESGPATTAPKTSPSS